MIPGKLNAAKSEVLHIHFICISLNVGGGEIMLTRICRELVKFGHRISIAVLVRPSVDSLSEELCDMGVELICLDINRPGSCLIRIIRWWRWLIQSKPHVIQGWMYHGNFMTPLALLAHPNALVFWSLHCCKIDSLKISTKIVVRICGYLSWIVPKKVFSASRAAIPIHVKYGYAPDRMEYLPNGLAESLFESTTRDRIRSGWNIPFTVPLVGWVGRDHSDKDFITFLRAAFLTLSHNSHMHFVAIGTGITPDHPEFLCLANRSPELALRIHLLGPQQNAVGLMVAFDLLAMSSKTEAFPLVLIEAMASGISAVATNVGDCSIILEDLGITVDPEDAQALSAAILAQWHRVTIDLDLSRLCRERVAKRYTMGIMVNSLLKAYKSNTNHEMLV